MIQKKYLIEYVLLGIAIIILVLIFFLLNIKQAEASAYFSESFDSTSTPNLPVGWTAIPVSTSARSTTTRAITYPNSVFFDSNGAIDNSQDIEQSGTLSEGYYQYNFWCFDSVCTGESYLLDTGSGKQLIRFLNNNFEIYDFTLGSWQDTGFDWTAKQWNLVTIYWNTSTGKYKGKLNYSAWSNEYDWDTTGNLNKIRIGANNSYGSCSETSGYCFFIDNYILSTTDPSKTAPGISITNPEENTGYNQNALTNFFKVEITPGNDFTPEKFCEYDSSRSLIDNRCYYRIELWKDGGPGIIYQPYRTSYITSSSTFESITQIGFIPDPGLWHIKAKIFISDINIGNQILAESETINFYINEPTIYQENSIRILPPDIYYLDIKTNKYINIYPYDLTRYQFKIENVTSTALIYTLDLEETYIDTQSNSTTTTSTIQYHFYKLDGTYDFLKTTYWTNSGTITVSSTLKLSGTVLSSTTYTYYLATDYFGQNNIENTIERLYPSGDPSFCDTWSAGKICDIINWLFVPEKTGFAIEGVKNTVLDAKQIFPFKIFFEFTETTRKITETIASSSPQSLTITMPAFMDNTQINLLTSSTLENLVGAEFKTQIFTTIEYIIWFGTGITIISILFL